MGKTEEMFACYIIEHNSTIRKCASFFGVGKSTVHNYLSAKLKVSNVLLYEQVQKILKVNFKEKHIRGGLATKLKYKS
jgi:putative DeoR family transcriptional regulator (stage III sporulation protein D)